MKFLKKFNKFNKNKRTQFFTTHSDTRKWLDRMGIKDYNIHENLVVDVRYVDISNKGLKHIPVQFGLVYNLFDCSGNELKSLIGSPYKTNIFSCQNNFIKSTLGCPKYVDVEFDIQNNDLYEINDLPLNFNSINIDHVFMDMNPINEILNLVSKEKLKLFIQYLNEYKVIRNINSNYKVDKSLLDEALYMVDVKPNFEYSFKKYEVI